MDKERLKELQQTDVDRKLLAFGFVRRSELLINNQPIPELITWICLSYSNIDTMEQLKEKRKNAKQNCDQYMRYHIEQLISDKVCTQKWNHQLKYMDLFTEILNQWIKQSKIHTFRGKIIEYINKSVVFDNVQILEILLNHCGYNTYLDDEFDDDHDRNAEIILFINNASKNNSFDCCKLLLNNPSRLDWSSQKRPVCLYNAIKYTQDIDLINFIIDTLKELKITFICDDIMKEIIRNDLDIIAKRIVNLRWHKISDMDMALAERINFNCFVYFNERLRAFNGYFNTNYNNDDNGLNIDIDEWNDDNDNNNDWDDDCWDASDDWDYDIDDD